MHRRLMIALGLWALATLLACSSPPTPDAPEPTTAIPSTPTIPRPTFTPAPVSTTILERYTVRSGDTLGGIAQRYDIGIDELMRINGLTNPNTLKAGQLIKIPVVVARAGPADVLLPDSEVVYGPAYSSFDTVDYVSQWNGYLASYREKVDGEFLSGAQIIQLVSERFSVGPRVLLALLEFQGGWLTRTTLTQNQLSYPMGLVDTTRANLFYQASWAANRLNEGYYGELSGRLPAFRFKDRTRARLAPGVNPGTAAVQNVLALTSNWETWHQQLGPGGFTATFRRLFGDPNAHAIDPLIPSDLIQPVLRLPWNDGATWYYTGGPHSGWGDLSSWSAIDLTPGDVSGSGTCAASRDWALAAAPGRVIRAEHGRVMVSLGNHNFQGEGWVLQYMHIANAGRVAVGTQVNAGDRIGHPSCEGGSADASHLHLARLYNGQWIDPDQVPFVLSGWVVIPLDQEYEGRFVRGSETREAFNGRDEAKNAMTTTGGAR